MIRSARFGLLAASSLREVVAVCIVVAPWVDHVHHDIHYAEGQHLACRLLFDVRVEALVSAYSVRANAF